MEFKWFDEIDPEEAIKQAGQCFKDKAYKRGFKP